MDKILIVDSSIRLLEVMKRTLERFGYTIKTLNSIDNITGEIRKFQPNLILLDTHLPGEDGREICKKLKTNFETKHLPVVLLSALPKALEGYKGSLANDYIEKPFNTKTLENKVSTVLNPRKAFSMSS